MRTTSRTIRTSTIGLAAAAVLALPLGAGLVQEDGAAARASTTEASEEVLPTASVPALSGQDTQVALDQGFAQALEQLKVTPGVVGDAKLQGGNTLVFPITGGNVTTFEPGQVDPYVVGQVQHEGSGLSLSAGGTTVEITDLNVDPTISKVYGDVAVDGQVAASSVPVFNLDGRTLQPIETNGDKTVLQGSEVLVSETAASLLGDTFDTQAIKRGLLVGTATITVDTTPAAG